MGAYEEKKNAARAADSAHTQRMHDERRQAQQHSFNETVKRIDARDLSEARQRNQGIPLDGDNFDHQTETASRYSQSEQKALKPAKPMFSRGRVIGLFFLAILIEFFTAISMHVSGLGVALFYGLFLWLALIVGWRFKKGLVIVAGVLILLAILGRH